MSCTESDEWNEEKPDDTKDVEGLIICCCESGIIRGLARGLKWETCAGVEVPGGTLREFFWKGKLVSLKMTSLEM